MADQSRLTVVPSTKHEANAYVAEHHRHHKPVHGLRFALAVLDEQGVMRGVAVIGRPKARMLDSRYTAEVTRVATDGCPNACSALYQAAWKACRAMGFTRLLTYTLPSESGTSLRALKAAGWRLVEESTGGGSWSRDDRPRTDDHPLEPKRRWEVRTDWSEVA